jgi:hypothetical protein
MLKHLARISIFTTAMALVSTTSRAQTTIAHWSFNTPSLTISGGNITGAADSTGVHNAVTAQSGSGGGCPCTTNPIPAANSIAGQFGQGLTLTGSNNVAGGGGQFLTYPILDELMTASSAPGAPNYTVSYWINTTTTNSHQFTLLSDWGNSATNPGRFTYGYGIQFTGGVAQMRAQARFNTTGAGNGTDIIARAVNAAAVNDGTWHMLTWTFDTTSGALTSYLDATPLETFNSAAANFNMILSSSPIGTIGLKGDSGNFINGTVSLDEMYVFNGALSQEQITELFQTNTPPGGVVVPVNLTLQIDPVTGAAQIKNTTSNPITFNSYRLTSPSGALNPGGWNPISNGNEHQAEFPLGNGTGNGWEVAPNPSSAELVEWYLTDDSTLNPNESLFLGNVFNPAGEEDVMFRYTSGELTVRNGTIEFVPVTPPAGVTGDYNNNGVVDAADYVAWRNNLNQSVTLPNDSTPGMVTSADYDVWRANFGRSAASSAALGASSAVPEPTTLVLLCLSVSLRVVKRRRAS